MQLLLIDSAITGHQSVSRQLTAQIVEAWQASHPATGETFENQAFRYGENAWGIQFHIEMTPDTVAEWSAVPEYAASMERALGATRAAGLGPELARDLPAFTAMARQINDNLMRAV